MQTQSCWIIGSGSLSLDDQKTLALLYQPLIGSSSLSLYLLMSSLVNQNLQSDVYPVQFLVDMLNISDKDYMISTSKLEAIGLLNTYSKEQILMYRLVMPLTPKQFLTDGVLGSFLKSELGETNFDLIRERFEVTEITRKGYTNITKSFDEVYQVKQLDQLNTPLYILGRKNSQGVMIQNTFDFDAFYQNLPVRLQKKSLFTKKIKDQIASINYVYQYDMATLNAIINEAYLEDNTKLFYERIQLIANKYNKNNHNKLEIDLKPETLDRPHLDQFTPQEILSHFAPTMTNNSMELETIRQFVERNAVDIGIINAVIIYALRLKKNLPNLVYLEKVLASMQEKGITTEALAYDYLMQTEKKEYKPTGKNKDRIVRDKPEWMDEFEKLVEERSK